jgi:hypothetical protein
VKRIWNLRIFMDVASNAMSAEVANDPETTRLRPAFDRTANVAQGRTRSCLRHAVFKRKTCRPQ